MKRALTLWFALLLTLLTAHGEENVIEFKAGREFAPVDMDHVCIQPGSALDLSENVPAPAGQSGRIIINDKGVLATAKEPAKTFRLFGGNGIPWNLKNCADDAAYRRHADEFAAAYRRQGYNALRVLDLDRLLMTGQKGTAPLELSPKQLDRWDYLLAAMKKQGCYFQLVIFGYYLYEPEQNHARFFRERRAHKLLMYAGHEMERQRFAEAAKKLLNHVNPYTGLAWKDDPAIAAVEFYNEQYDGLATLEWLRDHAPEAYAFYTRQWQNFLKRRFSSMAKAKRPAFLRNGFDVSVPAAGSWPEAKELFAEFNRILIAENNAFCTKAIRDAGYPGIVTQNSFLPYLYAAGAWSSIPAVDGHNYYEHPANWGSKGSRIRKISSVTRGALLYRGVNDERLLWRPILCGEFNHCFWSIYQHELPLTFSAYAAMADFSSHMILVDPVWVTIPSQFKRANIFDVGRSPVQRAGEFFSSLFFLRGDVTTARHQVENRASFKTLLKTGKFMSHQGEQGKLGLLTKVSLSFTDLPALAGTARIKPDLVIFPIDGGTSRSQGWFTETETHDEKAYLMKTVKKFREAGILPPGNSTDPAKGIYESETGEIILRERESLVKVVTPRSEAVSLLAGRSEKLSALTVNSTSEDALIGAAAADGKPLRESSRIVIAYATRMANHGMKLERDGETLIDLGWSPSLLKTGKCSIALENKNAENMVCHAIRMDGARTRALPVKTKGGILTVELDTAELGKDLTVFFELHFKEK